MTPSDLDALLAAAIVDPAAATARHLLTAPQRLRKDPRA